MKKRTNGNSEVGRESPTHSAGPVHLWTKLSLGVTLPCLEKLQGIHGIFSLKESCSK